MGDPESGFLSEDGEDSEDDFGMSSAQGTPPPGFVPSACLLPVVEATDWMAGMLSEGVYDVLFLEDNPSSSDISGNFFKV